MTWGRRRRRALLAAGAVAGAIAVAAGGWVLRQSQLDGDALAARDAGRTALAQGDWPAAMDGIGRYLQRFAERDAGARDYVAYARARRNVPIPNGRHVVGAIRALKKALELAPGDAEARRDLLDLYLTAGYATEAGELIDAMLVSAPDDVALLRRKCDLLEARRRFGPCLDVARRVVELAPADLDDHVRVLRLLIALDTPAGEIDAWIAAVEGTHADDPRFGILRAAALGRRPGDVHAKERLDGVVAATKGVRDPRFTRMLVGELDQAGRFDESLVVLGRTDDDADLTRELLRRLWYAGRAGEIGAAVEHRLQGAAGDELRGDPEVLALRALALEVSDRAAEAEPLRRELAAREDAAGGAWSSFVSNFRARGTADRRAAAAAMSAAVAIVPESGLLRQAQGDAYAALGETDLALEAWTEASARAPAWAAPLKRIARALVLAGRPRMAPPLAQAALARAPGDVEAFEIFVRAAAAGAGAMDRRQIEALLAVVRAFEAAAPGRTAHTLEITIDLLARTDRKAAEQRLREVLAAEPPASEETLLRLAAIAAEAGIDAESELFDLSRSAHGTTPGLTLARALARARVGAGRAGLADFDATMARVRAAADGDPGAEATGAADDWDLARSRLLDAVGDPGAAASWTTLADARPGSLPTQLAALASESVWKDREATARLIERVRGLTGEQGVTWRIASARWRLEAPSASGSDTADAARVLSDVIREAPRSVGAHALLARAMESLGNLPGAEEQLRLAAELAPDDPWIALDVARLAQAQGRGEAASRQLEHVLALRSLAPEQVQRAAYLLAASGDVRRGAGVLEPLVAAPDAPREGVVLLARMLAKLGEPAKAVVLCERLLASQPVSQPASRPDPATAELAADLYERLGRGEDAERALARLDAMDLPAGDRELARARHAASWGPAGAATDWYRRAVLAAPARADAWSARLSFAVASGDMAELDAVLDDPRAEAVETVRFVAADRASSRAAVGDERRRALLLAAIGDQPNRAVLAEAIRAAADWSEPARRADAASEIRRLAESNPGVLVLQLVAADVCAATGDRPKACEIAQRAASQFPASATAARQSAELLARSGRWVEAIDAGRLWRDRADALDLRPDVLVAEALTRTGRAGDGVRTLGPHVPEALGRRDENERLFLVYAVALTRDGRTGAAAELLADLARRSPAWRELPLVVDMEAMGDAATAVAWMRMCTALVPPDDTAARVRLARAWGAAWERYSGPELLAGAEDVLGALTASQDAPADAWFVAGCIAQRRGDLESAGRAYEAALRRDAGLLDARNNLAMTLADAGRWRDAVEEATRAARSAPDRPVYLDTLAYALRRGREYDRAKASLEQAIRLEPANPAWQVSLAETLVESGSRDEADRVASRVEATSASGPPMSASLRERLERLRRGLR